MNRFLILCSFLSLLPVWSYGQSFPSFADRPEWTYKFHVLGIPEDEMILKMTEEVTICDQVWNKVSTNKRIVGQWPDTTLVGYTRTVDKKTYFRHSANCSRPEWILYDFSLVAGDTFIHRWHYAFDTADLYATEVPMVVFNVEWWDLGGMVRKVIHLAGTYNDGPLTRYISSIWIEGIGAIEQPFVSALDTDSGFSDVIFWLTCTRYGEQVRYVSVFPPSPCAYNYTRLHVKHDVQGGRNDGSNWANAFRRLEDAIAVADPGDSIWVARGTYYPTTGSDKTAYFDLKNGLSIIGGFAGTETDYAQRLPQGNETILSGDIGVTGERSDNSFHVVYAHAADSTSLLEGFTIAHGNADSTLEISHWAYGGGMVILPGTQSHYRSAPRLRHCRFVDNYAGYGGGLAYFTGIEHSARADVRHCTFERNKGENGGAVLWRGGSTQEEIQYFADCRFEDNIARFGSGGLLVYDATGRFLFERCYFARDSCTEGSGALFINQTPITGGFTVQDCDFVDNYGSIGAAVGFFGISYYNIYHINIRHSRFFRNNNFSAGGSALHVWGSGDTTAINIQDCTFTENVSEARGAIYILANSLNYVQTNIWRSAFTNNLSTNASSGGAIHIAGDSGASGARTASWVENCLFTGNPGAVRLSSGAGLGDLQINNCSFYDNGNFCISKNWQSSFNANRYSRITISNSVLWEPLLPFNRIVSNGSSMQHLNLYRLDNCLVSAAECPDLPGSEQACGEGMLYGLDPMFADSAGGDFRPLPCSPLLDAGNNLWLPNADTDLAGQPRILGGTVDIGAYEVPAFRIGASEILRSPACHDSAEGAVSISTEAGQPFDLHWFNAAGQEGAAAENLYAGTYTFVAEHSSGCTDTLNLVLEAPAPIEADIVITPASNATATDGVALVQQITGGTAPYDIRWSNGASANGIGGLLPGDYTVSITDANDCLFTQTVTVSFTNAVPETQVLPGVFRVAPNPSGSEGAQLRAEAALSGAVQVEILDALGRRAAAAMYLCGRSMDLPRGLSPGMYLIVLRDEQGRQAVLRWVVIKR